jgi:hypothetical protein
MGNWYFLQHSYERNSVVWKKIILGSGWKSAIFFLYFFFIEICDLRYCKITLEYSYQHCLLRLCKIFAEDMLMVSQIATPSPHTHKNGRLTKKLVRWPMLFFLFFQPRTYVPIIRQKIANLVFLFEFWSNLLKFG